MVRPLRSVLVATVLSANTAGCSVLVPAAVLLAPSSTVSLSSFTLPHLSIISLPATVGSAPPPNSSLSASSHVTSSIIPFSSLQLATLAAVICFLIRNDFVPFGSI